MGSNRLDDSHVETYQKHEDKVKDNTILDVGGRNEGGNRNVENGIDTKNVVKEKGRAYQEKQMWKVLSSELIRQTSRNKGNGMEYSKEAIVSKYTKGNVWEFCNHQLAI